MLIDWLTLRTKINDFNEQALLAIASYLQGERLVKQSFDLETNEVLKTKLVVDVDKVRSDFVGMVWSISTNGADKYLNIGASPAYLKHGRNLFGDLNIIEAKHVLLDYVRKNLCCFLPSFEDWEIRRIDVTNNYFMQDKKQLKESLRLLRLGDGTRQRTTVSHIGDTVGFGFGSKSRSGKAYDKGEQAIFLDQKHFNKHGTHLYNDFELHIMQSVLRLELKLGSQFLYDEQARFFKASFADGSLKTYADFEREVLTPEFLSKQHTDFFRRYIGSIEVTDMETLLNKLNEVCPSTGQALATHKTWSLIRTIGYDTTKGSMPKSTFMRHQKYLLEAGLSQADLQSAVVIPFRRKTIELSQSINSWSELEHAYNQSKAA